MHSILASRRNRSVRNVFSFSFPDSRQSQINHGLRSSDLFAGLSTNDLDAIATITDVKRLTKGEYLFHEGEPSKGFFVVQKGAINVHRVNGLGKEQIIHIFRAGESLAQETVASLPQTVTASSGYPADARAIEDSQVLRVQKAGFVELVRHHSEFGLRLLASMHYYLRVLVSQIEDLTLKDVETRMATWLLKRCPNLESEEPVEIRLNLTKRVLAAELGTVSETFSRTLTKFREQELVRVKGKTIVVLSPARLEAFLDQH